MSDGTDGCLGTHFKGYISFLGPAGGLKSRISRYSKSDVVTLIVCGKARESATNNNGDLSDVTVDPPLHPATFQAAPLLQWFLIHDGQNMRLWILIANQLSVEVTIK